MTETNETTKATETADTAPQWAEQVLVALDAIEAAEPVRRLYDLFGRMPDTSVELLAATASVLARLGSSPSDALDVQKTRARDWVNTSLQCGRNPETAVRDLIDKLAEHAEVVAFREWETSTGEPCLRLADYRHTHRRDGVAAVGAYRRKQYATAAVYLLFAVLPKNSPLRGITPFDAPSLGAILILGAIDADRFRMSEIQRRTQVEIDHALRIAEASAERVRQERQAERQKYLDSPAGMAERLRELEAEVSRAKADKAGA